MIILDTNVVSELMRPMPSAVVISWLEKYRQTDVYLTTITAAELWYGVHLLPEGKKKSELGKRLRSAIEIEFKNRVLEFDEQAAETFGYLHAAQKRTGRLPDFADTQIAAIAITNGAGIATRNVDDFRHAEIDILNPWA
jgi:toxin FitB